MPVWYLEDLTKVALTHKYTFYRPSADVIAKVRIGELVKLIFVFKSHDSKAPRAERMWVEVESINPSGEFMGRLTNQPRYIKDLVPGDLVTFDQRHVANTEHDEQDNLVEKYLSLCFVTNRVLRDAARIGYLYREDPDNDKDSGWRFMAGDESDEYMDDPRNVAVVSLGAVLNLDDSILSLLDAPSGSAFDRDPMTGMFVPTRRG